ncbi:diguanylate cyclase (GGDEF) domain-containing protein [Ruminococcaceae bacterium YRB3002]|nr:diguanylate cyclase (GGDEF) domain-containing protein [Ruminococcaceae bacterium YRB3002]
MKEDFNVPEGFEFIWNDEFKGDALSFAEWNQEIHDKGSFFNELQRYVASETNIYARDSKLVIRPVKETFEDGSVKYTSGRISTAGKHVFRYGRFEARVRVPRGKGLRSVFSLSTGDHDFGGRWPNNGEIDIMEFNGSEPGILYGSLHSGADDGADNHVLQQGIYKMPSDTSPSDDFHTYACEWDPGVIRFYCDDIMYFSCSEPKNFTNSLHLVFAVAVGGDWPGDPDSDTIFDENNVMEIDYIRVFRRTDYPEIKHVNRRKMLGVCGVWEDAENFNMFLRSLQCKEILDRYVITVFTLSIPSPTEDHLEADMRFTSFIDTVGLSGLIIFGEMIKNEKVITRLIGIANRHNIPVMMFEKYMSHCVNFNLDYAGGFEQMVRHVVEHHGCREVDMFAGFRGNPFSEERINVYRKVLEENGIPFEEMRVHYGDFWDATAYQVLSGLMTSGYKLPQAFVCANDSMAIGVCDALKKHNVRIPEDCIVTGFDGIWKSNFRTPAITTCEPDYNFLRDKIIEILNKGTCQEDDISVGYKMICRHSCNCEPDDNEKWPVIVSDLNEDNQDYFRHILEMGRFISRTISMSDVVEASADLQSYLWLWKEQYYFIGLREDGECIHAIFEGHNGEYKFDRKFFNMPEVLPELGALLEVDSGVNYLLFKQAKARTESFGYIATGMAEITLRSEQRFEEFSLFVSAMIHSVINNRQLINANKEIERMSESDYLTGLYNRRGFMQEVSNCIGKAENKGLWFTMFSADLDGLKNINDYYGHNEGDLAIKSLANAIRLYVGNNGFCARFGGDEFAFVIIGSEPISGKINHIRERISEIIQADNSVSGKRYRVKASIGCGEGIIDDNINIDAIAHIADVEMYKDKYSKR